ncbi:hypothetical protein WDZ92_50595 [Nostoc sp. NIES-2111]
MELSESHWSILRSARGSGRIALPMHYRDDATLADLVSCGLLEPMVHHDLGAHILVFALTNGGVSVTEKTYTP